jgi:hypothetical protein
MVMIVIIGIGVAAVLALQLLRWNDGHHADAAWLDLAGRAPPSPKYFDPSIIEGLPDAARRYFLFSIAPGTPLRTVTEIRMTGQIGMGTRDAPNYQPMQAHQILAPPHGFVWKVDAGAGLMRFTGSDGHRGDRSWTRFWLLKLLPVVRVGGNPDHERSSFGRVAAEAVFWSPASLLPQEGVEWHAGSSPDRARAVVSNGRMTQELEITVEADGRPDSVVIPRWSNANPEQVWQVQPFGGTLSEFRTFGGYTLATRIDGGNHIGTPEYFPFFRAEVQEIRFLGGGDLRQETQGGLPSGARD